MKHIGTILFSVALLFSFDFSPPDSEIKKLAESIIKNCRTDKQKVDAIYDWITDNIEYDLEIYHKVGRRYPEFKIPFDGDTTVYYKEYNEKVATMVLKRNKGICDGYSRLFKALCDEVEIESQYIPGKVRLPLNKELQPHAWNAVRINGTWHLLDLTWASGTVNVDYSAFIKEKNPFYYLTPPEKMIVDHYPDELKWTLLKNPPDINDFANQPLQNSHAYHFGLKEFAPTQKEIIIEKDKLIKVILEFDEKIPFVMISESNMESKGSRSGVKMTENNIDSIYQAIPDFFLIIPKIEIVEKQINGNQIVFLIKPLTKELEGLDVLIGESMFTSIKYDVKFKD